MKRLFVLFSIGLIACSSPKKESDKENISMDKSAENKVSYQSYGSKIDAVGAFNVSELERKLQREDTVQVKLEAVIKETCTKKGCWMTVGLGSEKEMMVRFKDYDFFVPTEGQSGKTTIFSGKAFRDTVSIETLQHYAADGGKTKEEIEQITEPEITIAFIADGVIIKQ